MLSETLTKFGHPESLIKEYDHWFLLLRPAQVTLGSMIIISKTEDNQFHELSEEAFNELKQVTADIETKLKGYLQFEKVNYKMLMMVDPEVHFHVFPRYPKVINFNGRGISDPYWPGICDLSKPKEFEPEEMDELLKELRTHIN